jgi:hypothetical protein
MPIGLDRLFLHASEITFTDPNGTLLTLGAPLTPDLQKVIDMLK